MSCQLSAIRCQLHSVPQIAEPLGKANRLWQLRNRLKRILKRRLTYLGYIFSQAEPKTPKSDTLQTGDIVRVRLKEEIQGTLNTWNQLKGCAFMEEMWPHCGTQQRVLKRIEKFLDERDYLVKKTKGVVILDGVMCQGTKDFGCCDRSCFFFWREEWLEKIRGDREEGGRK